MKIILSTRNPSKAVQIQGVFQGSPVQVLTLDEAGIEGEAVEDGLTLRENALKKALYAHEHSEPDSWTMADDTGFFIDALDGRPGIKAARWAGETATTDQITQHTLKAIKDAADRGAYFETVVAIVSPDGKQYFFDGLMDGHILEVPRTEPQPMMPYSSIFVPKGTDLVWAEMSVEMENSISHRGIAFRKARAFLETQ